MPFDGTTSAPSLTLLSEILRGGPGHPMWPAGFEWNYERCSRCAMGLALRLWKEALPPLCGPSFLYAMQFGAAFSMDAVVAERIFNDLAHPGMARRQITPAHVADALDEYLRENEGPSLTMLDPERWRAVNGWPYEVSSHGRVRRLAPCRNRGVGFVLALSDDGKGYHRVKLYDGATGRYFHVHTLVCIAFHGERPAGKTEVRHLDGGRATNWPANLIWGTAKENADDRERHGSHPKGGASSRAKLSQKSVDALRREYSLLTQNRCRVNRGWCQKMGAIYGVAAFTISRICSGRYSYLAAQDAPAAHADAGLYEAVSGA